MNQSFSITFLIPTILSIISLFLYIRQYIESKKSKIRCIIENKLNVHGSSGSFVTYTERYLLIRNLSKRDTVIIDICEFNPEDGLIDILYDKLVPLKGWSVFQHKLTGDHIETPPLALLIRDMDNNTVYGIDVVNIYSNNNLSTRIRKFKSKEHFLKYYLKLNEKLRKKGIESLKYETSPIVKNYIKQFFKERNIKPIKVKSKGKILY